MGYPVEAFNSAGKPTDPKAAERFVNRRAQAYWAMRDALEGERLALPRAHGEQLTRELLATNWAPTGAGKVLIESKRDIKAKLGGPSPDYADALAMAIAPGGLRFVASAAGVSP